MIYCRIGEGAPPPPEQLTFPEDIDPYFGGENSNRKICKSSDGSLDTIISCVKFHISSIENYYWRWKRDCPDEEIPKVKRPKQEQEFRRIVAQYENNEVCA